MKWLRFALVIVLLPVAFAGCKLKDTSATDGSGANAAPPAIPAPPDVAAPPANALKTASGLASKVLTVGLGNVHPNPQSMVTVHYTGWTADGKMFDSSIPRGEPTTFLVGQVIPGWVEALQLMVVGEKRRFWIPGNLAYDGSPDPRDPKGTLCFEIELLSVK